MPYWRLYYHVVWATKHRDPVIADALIPSIVEVIERTCRESGVTVLAVGVMPDHVHVLAQIPPTVTLSSVIGQWKGASSHVLNTIGPHTQKFAWQSGYGVLSVSSRSLDQVREYVENQRERHAAREVYGVYERTEDSHNASNSAHKSQ